MSYQFVEEKKAIINKVVEMIKEKISMPQAKLCCQFTEFFYSTMAYDDLRSHTIEDLYGAAVSLWKFVRNRKANETKIRVYNPNFEQHGWQSTHTILEISQADIPFLVDSVRMEMNRMGFTTHLIIHYGGLNVKRDANHQIVDIATASTKKNTDFKREAVLFLEIDRQTDPEILQQTHNNLERILNDVTAAVEDWKPMQDRVRDIIKELEMVKDNLDANEYAESIDFLNWAVDHHFTFLGVRDYDLVDQKGEKVLKIHPDSGLGVLRETNKSHVSHTLTSMSPEARKLALSHQILLISKTNTISTVHRQIYTDYIGIKRFDKKGNVIGERRLIGLYTSAAYNTSPRHIPFLRRKVSQVLEMTKLNPKSHGWKVLLNIIETLPRDDLFQASAEELLDTAMGIFHIQERRCIRLFARKDVYGRFVSCLVYLPKDRFNTQLLESMKGVFQNTFNAEDITFSTRFTDSVLARIHFTCRIDQGETVEVDVKAIEQQLIDVARSWVDEFQEHMLDSYGEERGNALFSEYREAFPIAYREDFGPRSAVYDIKHMELLSPVNTIELNFFRPIDAINGKLRLKIYQMGKYIPLSDVLPILENMGMRVMGERPYKIIKRSGDVVWINDFGMEYTGDGELEIDAIRDDFQLSFESVWFDHAENDGFNELILRAGLNWHEVAMLRAYAKYLRQTGFTFSQDYIENAMSNNPDIAKMLVELFHARFDPQLVNEQTHKQEYLEAKIHTALDQVTSLDEDRILRRYLDVLKATLRTNYYQLHKEASLETQIAEKSYISLKLDSANIPELPLPKPMFEIFVYSPRFEGVHLRGAKVARGGLRWSDRREDFRTEVLGLMKAQQVKNAVIVPSGAKGGFVPKHLPTEGGRDAIMEEGIACYKTFIRGLLDITDNLVNNEIVPPVDTVRHDEDDPYLVVAADKGTATFSDIANSISAEYNFWLGDAFASGGSAGYDHKGMGITARGAWESVKRHFRELGLDTQNEAFTVIGIGDMAGDVFGNGMLLSEHIKLVGAFNHLHIFLDPNPDTVTSYAERKRLFELSRSGWSDYNEKLISKGGGIFNRSAKSIKLTPEIKQMLGLTQDFIVPNELIRAMLKAEIDLLWNGGIGTFVKATTETNLDVGDRTNDAIRIDATELRTKVVGEGGNLGITQLARAEYNLEGGKVYTDFIDNSAGVDCSDHEVNIKILLNKVVANGDLTEKQRNILLASMTDEVAELVLQHNYSQTQAISLAFNQANKNVELHSRFINELEKHGWLERQLEYLPDEKTLMERKLQGRGLTSPGIAVLLAYSKSILKDQILASDLIEDPYLANMLEQAFPQPLREKYRSEMEEHPLRNEIIATQLSNDLVNEMGFTFVYRLNDETGAPPAAIVRTYTIARNILNVKPLWEQIDALDNKVTADVQVAMLMQIIRVLRRTTSWFLRNRRTHLDIADTIEFYSTGMHELKNCLADLLGNADKKRYEKTVKEFTDANVPLAIAEEIATMRSLISALDIIEVASELHVPVAEVAKTYFAVGDYLDIGWIRLQVTIHQVENHWEALSREALRNDIDWQQRQLTLGVLQSPIQINDLDKRIQTWLESYSDLVQRWHHMLADLRGTTAMNFTMFFVAIRELSDLTQTSVQRAVCSIPEDHPVNITDSNKDASKSDNVVVKANQTKTNTKPKAKKAANKKTKL